MPRRGVPRVCRAVAGLEGCSQAALQRNACIRKVFAGSLAAVRRRSVCAQLKLQAVSAGRGTGLCVAPLSWGCCAGCRWPLLLRESVAGKQVAKQITCTPCCAAG